MQSASTERQQVERTAPERHLNLATLSDADYPTKKEVYVGLNIDADDNAISSMDLEHRGTDCVT
jgi:hypothetical protein